jgi:TonB family protein
LGRGLVALILLAAVGCGTSFTSRDNARYVRTVEDALDYDSPPVLVKAAKPDYPAMAREVGAQGRTVLKVLILEDGTIGAVEILECPNPILVDAAITALRKSLFAPATKGGRAVRATLVVPFLFSSQETLLRVHSDFEAGHSAGADVALPVEPPTGADDNLKPRE